MLSSKQNLIHTQHGILGQHTTYPTTYSPKILHPIARSLGRSTLALPAQQLSLGVDFWQCFEISWLNPQGVSQVAMARLTICASSPFIIESKSLKLYLNSLNFTEFTNQQEVAQTIKNDLSACLQSQVSVDLFELWQKETFLIAKADGECLDNLPLTDKVALTDDVQPCHLNFASDACDSHWQVYHSHLLRSNCPVTNQPDWGTVQLAMTCPSINKQCLLKYILSYRKHNGFHEQCVEQIFADVSQAFCPTSLLVRAWYTRRGGIDISPVRVSDMALLPIASRLIRQ